MYLKPLLLTSTLLLLTGCSDDEKLEALLKHTKENMVFVKGGTFMMGDPFYIDNTDGRYKNESDYIFGSPENKEKYPDAKWLPVDMFANSQPAHKVKLDDFYISKYEVTWAEYDAYCELIKQEKYEEGNPSFWRHPEYPVYAPSWQEAKDYCLWLGEQTGEHYDLATEAQWEYAARSRGKYEPYATHDGTKKKEAYHAKEEINIAPNLSPVGSYPPNPLGLYDMSGNLREWTNDWYDEDYYKHSPEENPKGPDNGTQKVLRGDGDLVYSRQAKKTTNEGRGFRCVLNP